jgi:hypothetical protein
MNRITRESFIDSMGGPEGAGLDLTSLDETTEGVLDKAGIGLGDLSRIAGNDNRIDGGEELSKLFDLIDRVDRDGSYDSIATTRRASDGSRVSTVSGDVARALKGEVDRARLGQGATPPSPAYQKALATLEGSGLHDIHLASNTPHFYQLDAKWAGHPYPKSPPEEGSTRTLGDAGCAPCALAMADVTLRGPGSTPTSVGDFAIERGFSGLPSGQGSDTVHMGRAWAEDRGLLIREARLSDQTRNAETLWDRISSGGVGVVSVGSGHFTKGGHVLVVNGCARDTDGQEWFFVVDPGHRHPSNLDATLIREPSLPLEMGGLRISRSQLEHEMKGAYVLGGTP